MHISEKQGADGTGLLRNIFCAEKVGADAFTAHPTDSTEI